MKKTLLMCMLVAVLGVGWFVFARNDSPVTKRQIQGGFDKSSYSLTDPASIWVIANKQYPLKPGSYKPIDLRAPEVRLRLDTASEEMQLRETAARAVEKMFAKASQDNIELMISSAFRSYDYQRGLYANYVKTQGQATADTQSARPGYSEHQTGWALDVEPASRACEVEECFVDTPEGKWVAANAYKYGFVIRYPKDKQHITGYVFEPWHLRYVGTALSTELQKQGNPTLEEFFGLPAAPDYR